MAAHPSSPLGGLRPLLVLLLVVLLVHASSAGDPVEGRRSGGAVAERFVVEPVAIRNLHELTFTEPAAPPGLAPTDTVYLMGGPGQLSGRFQDAAGLPDRQGWRGVDLTQSTTTYWQTSTFNAANLDTSVGENHAWWCGGLFPPCTPEDPPEGYGNGWYALLDWYGTVPDPSLGVTVRVKARLNIETEPALDYLFLRYNGIDYMHKVKGWDGLATGINVNETFFVTPAEFVGESDDQVHLRWSFASDGGWSDEDCGWATEAGAAQIDLIEVYFDQSEGEIQVGVTETCEPGDPVQWQETFLPAVGDFSKVWPLLDDLDPVSQNDTPQFAFIDDGIVVPGTDGSTCTSWCYGPGGYIVNATGGLAGEYYCLENEIWSPALARSNSNLTGALLSFDVYVHVEATSGGPAIYHYWKVRSKNELTGPDSWTDWGTRRLWYGGGPSFVREHHNISDLLLEDYTHVQLALGIIELDRNGTGNDGTPAPYFDNVSLKVYEEAGPGTILVRADGSGEYPTIQAAIMAAADHDTILLDDGVFTGSGNRDITYLDKILLVRSLSGDPTACIIDCQGTEADPHRGFLFSYNPPGVGLDGVTVRNGYVVDSGGGIACRWSSPTIRNCIIENNTSVGINNFAGGLYCQNASPTVSDCVFRGNTGYRGGAVGIGWDSHAVISGCLFEGNSSAGYGSAVACWYFECNTAVDSCTFTANEAPGTVGILSCRYDANLQVRHSIIADNVSGQSVSCIDGGTVSLTCCDIFGNPGGDWVGCIASQLGTAGNISLDPLFCGSGNPFDPYTLLDISPCAPEFNPDCGLLGARSVACLTPTGVDDLPVSASTVALEQNSPNPFNPQTTIAFYMPSQAAVRLAVYDVSGRLVDVIIDNEIVAQGRNEVVWRGRDMSGRVVSAGVYFYRLEAGSYNETKRMVLVK